MQGCSGQYPLRRPSPERAKRGEPSCAPAQSSLPIRDGCKPRLDLVARPSLPEHDHALLVQPNDVDRVLADVHSYHVITLLVVRGMAVPLR